MTDPINQRHYSTQELAEFLRVHPETIRREAAKGRLRSIRVGSDRRYPESAVKDYLDERGNGEPKTSASSTAP